MRINGSTTGSADKAKDIGSSKATGIAKEKSGSKIIGDIDSGVADKVAISSRAKDSAKAKEIANSSPDIDDAKVAKLKSAIQSGNYNVDADKVADRMVEEHLSTAF